MEHILWMPPAVRHWSEARGPFDRDFPDWIVPYRPRAILYDGEHRSMDVTRWEITVNPEARTKPVVRHLPASGCELHVY
jgi:hypothetical protein